MQQKHDFGTDTPVRHAPSLRVMTGALALAFFIGVAVVLLLTRAGPGFSDIFSLRYDNEAARAPNAAVISDAPALPLASPRATESPRAASATAREAAQRVERVVEQQGGLDSRLAAMEQRLTRLDIQSQAAAGNAARAEALLIAFASRRVIERGEPLGYLADQLRLRFGEDRPNAVQTIIDAAQDPVTLEQLLARLDGLAPALTDSPEGEGLFARIARGLSELFVIRREDTPSPDAEKRLERARLRLESGRIEAAISEIQNLPNAVAAQEWLEDAERFASAQRALETLETAAVLDPRELRDGSGDRVEQRSPAGNAPQL